jgi:hypothetical protein
MYPLHGSFAGGNSRHIRGAKELCDRAHVASALTDRPLKEILTNYPRNTEGSGKVTMPQKRNPMPVTTMRKVGLKGQKGQKPITGVNGGNPTGQLRLGRGGAPFPAESAKG